MIKNKRKPDQCFSFGPVTDDDILKKTNNLDTAKASQQSDVPTKILKQNLDWIFRWILLWKYKPVYFEIIVPTRFKISQSDTSL